MNTIPMGTQLSWRQVAGRTHELSGPIGLHARVELALDGAVAESASGRWRLDRDVTGTIRIWNANTGELVASASRRSFLRYRRRVSIGSTAITWEPANMWHTKWRFRAGDELVMELRRSRGVVRAAAEIELLLARPDQ